MKKTVIAVITIFLATLICIYATGYHGQRDFTGEMGTLPHPETVVANARSLRGAPYDPLAGKYGNIGAAVGFIVCSDVPNIAYGLSGFSLQAMLEEDFRKNPSAYAIAEDNRPGNPYFHRRARNLHAFFKANDRLILPKATPRVGDLAFYKRKSHGYVSHVALVTEVREAGYSVLESAPETVFAQELPDSSLALRGYITLGFGRLLYDVHDKRIQSGAAPAPRN